MLNWLRNRWKKAGGFRNPDQLPESEIELLRDDLTPLDELRQGLAGECLHYLVEGQSSQVLGVLKATGMAGVKLKLQASKDFGWEPEARTRRAQLFTSPTINKLDFVLRLSALYLAAVSPLEKLVLSPLKNKAPGVEVLLQEVYPEKSEGPTPILTFETVSRLLKRMNASPDLLHHSWLLYAGRKFGDSLMEMPGFRQGLSALALLEEGSVDQKVIVLENLARLGTFPESAQPTILEMARGKSKKLKRAAELLLSHDQPPASEPAPPPQPEELDRSPLAPELLALMKTLVEQRDARAQEVLQSGKFFKEPVVLGPEGPDLVVSMLNDWQAGSEPACRVGWSAATAQSIETLLGSSQLTLIQALRLAVLTGILATDTQLKSRGAGRLDRFLTTFRKGRESECTLVAVEQALTELGYQLGELNREHPLLLLGESWEDEGVWPFFAAHAEELHRLLSHRFDWVRESALLETLWDLALEGTRRERELARPVLARVEGFDHRLRDALGAGSHQVRSAAASWLEELKDEQASDDLLQAARKEKVESARAAMLSALEALGQSIEEFISPQALGAEAEKGMKKGVPAGLDWLPMEGLPALHWENGEEVEPQLTSWLLVRAFKLKDPEPGPILRRYADRFKKDEAREFALVLLEAFLSAEDESAAIKAKGVLSLCGAMGDGRVAPPIERYLKKWYGHRLHHCKALLAVLAAVEEPACLQLLLSVANRFRTKGLQSEAERLVGEVALRKGWSCEELADRTVPTAGLDEEGVLELDFGPRRFLVTLDDRLNLVVKDEKGKPRKSLPKAAKSDEPDLAKAANKQITASKKELTSVLELQTRRLREAMVTQREWSYEEWQTYLANHPILGRLSRGLIWHCPQREIRFRPLGDGSLTDQEDTQVELASQDRVMLVHRLNLSEKEAQAWSTHLSDYEVLSPFDQLEIEILSLSDEQKASTEYVEFQGHTVETFPLRSQLTAAGYTRGETLDGGGFTEYVKSFPSLGLTAVVHFSGSQLPETNQEVTLGPLSFRRQGEQPTLGEVPLILLCDCRNDLKRVALS